MGEAKGAQAVSGFPFSALTASIFLATMELCYSFLTCTA
jgi:hypothetical protein